MKTKQEQMVIIVRFTDAVIVGKSIRESLNIVMNVVVM